MMKSDSEGLTSGRPILYAEGQFVACHFSPSEYVPFRKIGRRNLKEILRKASDTEDRGKQVKTRKKEKPSRNDEFEMIYLNDSCTEEESYVHVKNVFCERNNTECQKQQEEQQHAQQQQEQERQLQQQFFAELLQWISQEGEEFVYIESFSDPKEVFDLLDIIGRSRTPILTTVLIHDNAPNLITVSVSSVNVGVQCLLFCMFQASAEE